MSSSTTKQKVKRPIIFRRKKKKCKLCVEKIKIIDYKDVELLKNYITDRGKIISRRVSGNCAKHQRMISKAIKRSRQAGLLPYTIE